MLTQWENISVLTKSSASVVLLTMKAYLLHDHSVTINMTDQQLLVMVRRWRPTVTQPMEWYQQEERNQSMR
jgi:hypothetical protein